MDLIRKKILQWKGKRNQQCCGMEAAQKLKRHHITGLRLWKQLFPKEEETNSNSLCTEQYEWFTFLANSWGDLIWHFLCISLHSNKHFLHSYENNTDTVTSRATLQINLSLVCSTVNDNLQCRPQWVTNLVNPLKILDIWVWIIFWM